MEKLGEFPGDLKKTGVAKTVDPYAKFVDICSILLYDIHHSYCTLQTTGSRVKSARAHQMVSTEDPLETRGNRSVIAKKSK